MTTSRRRSLSITAAVGVLGALLAPHGAAAAPDVPRGDADPGASIDPDLQRSQLADALQTVLEERFASKYGGLYLSAGKLRVRVTADGADAREFVTKEARRRGIADSVEFLTATHPMSDLLALRDRVTADHSWLRNQGIQVSEWGPDDLNNAVRVGVVDLTPEKAALLRARYGDDINVFSASEFHRASRTTDSAPWYGGDKIRSEHYSSPNCSEGFGVLKGGKEYMLTAGHCSTPQGSSNKFYQDQTGIGSTAYMAFSNGGSTDAQLIPADMTPYTWGSTAVHPNATWSSTSTNQSVCVNGAFHGQTCSTTVIATNQCIDFGDGITTCKLAETYRGDVLLLDGLGGDSGGPVFSYYSDGNRLNLKGIIIGGSSDDHTAVFSPITVIDSVLGTTPMTTP
jgi:hypothetical protein